MLTITLCCSWTLVLKVDGSFLYIGGWFEVLSFSNVARMNLTSGEWDDMNGGTVMELVG